MAVEETGHYDLLVVGGGINGTGIARDAAGRGLRVALCEMGDLAGATSSASSKLIHGGLRYLEHFEFRLVRESLRERERLLRNAPHLVTPMRFVLPHGRGLRPRWMLRAGLFLYDLLAGRSVLPRTAALALDRSPLGQALQPGFRHGYAYSDCWADDARLVIANATDAAERGAEILVGTACVEAVREQGVWRAELEDRSRGDRRQLRARALANVAGPWAARLLERVERVAGGRRRRLRLVQGSHVVVPRLHDGSHAYLLQNDDRRVVFVLPFLERFTLIGTTDVSLQEIPAAVEASPEEVEYLCRASNAFLQRQVRPEDVIWSYSGIRALLDDGSDDPSKVTRDYRIEVEDDHGQAPLLSVFGGKLTSYRALAERAVDRLRRWLPNGKPAWTADAVLPGGDVPQGDLDALHAELVASYPQLPADLVRALAQRHGTRSWSLLGEAVTREDLGRHFGAQLYEREVSWMMEREWARQPADVLWRRSKEGLFLDAAQQAALADYMASRRSG